MGRERSQKLQGLEPILVVFGCLESTCEAGDLGSIPRLGRSPGEGKGYPLQYSGLENSMDCIIQGVTKSQTQLSDFHLVVFIYFFLSLDFFFSCGGSSLLHSSCKCGLLFVAV